MSTHPISLTRRSVLALGLAGVAGCGSPGRREEPGVTASTQPWRGRLLLAYFSRPGENYHYGGRRTLDVGNTERCHAAWRAAPADERERVAGPDQPRPSSRR